LHTYGLETDALNEHADDRDMPENPTADILFNDNPASINTFVAGN